METMLSLEERLKEFPKLRSRMEEIVKIAENEGELMTADEGEERVTEEIQKLAREVLQGWAEKGSRRCAEEQKEKDKRAYQNGKKNCAGKANTERSK